MVTDEFEVRDECPVRADVTSLLLLRHGESTWNATRRWQGRADPPLSRKGERQAVLAARSLGPLQTFDLVVTSALQRAQRTGELLATTLAVPLGPRIRQLDERAAGVWEGLTRDEINKRFPGYLDDGRRPDGYENDAAVAARAVSAIERLGSEFAGRRIIVVSHGGVIGAIESHVGVPLDHRSAQLGNLSGRWFEFAGQRLRAVSGRVNLVRPSPSEVEIDDEGEAEVEVE